MSDKAPITQEGKKRNTAKKRVSREKRKRDIVSMVSIILLSMFAMFAMYSLLDKGDNSETSGPAPMAEDDSMMFEFDITSSEKYTIDVLPGEVFTVTFRIYRMDADSDFIIHSVQNEIEFDSSVFELNEESISCDYRVSVHEFARGKTRLFMNAYAVTAEGFEYIQGETFCSFTLTVKDNAPAGSYYITNNEYEMSDSEGHAKYAIAVKDLTVNIVSR